jgi:hypothetical protein
MEPILYIKWVFGELTQCRIWASVGAIAQGKRYRVPCSIRWMNDEVLRSHYSSPWYGNRPNFLGSEGYWDWMDETYGLTDWDDYDDEYEDDTPF